MKPSVLVVGLGRFGTAAALELMALGHEVLALAARARPVPYRPAAETMRIG